MSFKTSYQRMAIYNQRMNKSAYKAAAKLSVSELNRGRGAYFGSIIGTLNHILVGDITWFKRFADHPTKFPALEHFRALEKPSSLAAII